MKNSPHRLFERTIPLISFVMVIAINFSCNRNDEVMNRSNIVASFETKVSESNSLTYSFINNSLVDGNNDGSYTSSWDFGGTGTSTDKNPTHTFSSPGTYEVILIVTSTDGEVDTDSKTIVVEVSKSAPVAMFVASQELDKDFAYSFQNTSKVTEISDTSFTSSWDFGGDGTSIENSPIHTFSSVGIYEVTLTITAADGEVDTVIDTLIVELSQSKPVAGFIANAELNQDLTFSFINTSVVTGILDNSFTSLWDFGGDGTSTENSPTHTFSTAGYYEILLTVTAADGEVNTVTDTVEVKVITNKYARITDTRDDDTGELRLSVNSIQTGRLSFVYRVVEGPGMDIKDAFINVAGTSTTSDFSITEIRLKDDAPHEFREGASPDAIAAANFPEGKPDVWVPIEISWDAGGSSTPRYSVTIDGQSVITEAISTTNGGLADVDDHLASVLHGARNFQWKYSANSLTSDGEYHVDNIIIYSSDSGTETVIFEDNFEEREVGENLNPSFNANSPYHLNSVDATVGADQ